MSGDDYISKLFLDNEHKLDEMPSEGLWGRIESKLDANIPGESTETSTVKASQQVETARKGFSMIRLVPYMAAAAVLLILVCLPFMMNNGTVKQTIAENDKMPKLVEVVLDEEAPEPLLSPDEREQAYKEKDKAQSQKINAMAKKVPVSTKKTELVLAESENSIIELTPEPRVDKERAYLTKPTNSANAGNINTMDEKITLDAYTNAGRNYAPQGADLSKRAEIQEIANAYDAKEEKKVKKEDLPNDDYNMATIRSRSKDAKDDSYTKKGENFLVAQLQIFDWMLGEWVDKDVDGGESHEVWKRISPTTIECNGYKLKRKTKEKIFEEKISIYYDPSLKQVFMKMPIDDAGQQVVYMLTKFDTEYITFEQKEHKNFPDEVVFQRSMRGFKVIINHNGNFLESNQQAYFSNRNRVTNVRAIRVMESARKK